MALVVEHAALRAGHVLAQPAAVGSGDHLVLHALPDQRRHGDGADVEAPRLHEREVVVEDRLVTDVVSSYAGLRDHIQESVSPAWVHGGELSEGDREEGVGYVPEPVSGIQVDTGLLVGEALATLEEPHRTVFVLRHYQGWPVESKHPGDPTISGYFGVTSRTVRNWLTTAEKRLAEWREERI